MNLLFDNNCVSNSPSKIDQWCKPKPAAKLVLALVRRSPLMLKELVRRSPLMLKERVRGSMIYSSNNNFAIAIPLCPSGTSPSLGEVLSLDYTFCNNLIKMLML